MVVVLLGGGCVAVLLYCCMEVFAERVARFLNQAEDGPCQAANPCSLLMRVHMATMRLLDGDAMRCRTQQELHVDWRDRVQRARCYPWRCGSACAEAAGEAWRRSAWT